MLKTRVYRFSHRHHTVRSPALHGLTKSALECDHEKKNQRNEDSKTFSRYLTDSLAGSRCYQIKISVNLSITVEINKA